MDWLALSLLALVLFIILLSVVEALWVKIAGMGLVPWLRKKSGRSLTSTALDDFSLAFHADKQIEFDEREAAELMAEDDEDGAPPHLRTRDVDLDAGVVFLRPRDEPGDRPN